MPDVTAKRSQVPWFLVSQQACCRNFHSAMMPDMRYSGVHQALPWAGLAGHWHAPDLAVRTTWLLPAVTITQITGTCRMNTSLKQSFALLCMVAPLLAGCDALAGKKDYAYFRQHLDEAKSVSDQCQLNGTSGMEKSQIAKCNAAHDAYANRNYSY
jgi:hypothetical protein